MQETNNILAILNNYLHDNPDEIGKGDGKRLTENKE